MHIININLHNSKTLWFSVLKFLQHVRIDLLYVRAKFQKFSSLRGRDPRGGAESPPPPPPPRTWDRQKSPALLGLKTSYNSHYLSIVHDHDITLLYLNILYFAFILLCTFSVNSVLLLLVALQKILDSPLIIITQDLRSYFNNYSVLTLWLLSHMHTIYWVVCHNVELRGLNSASHRCKGCMQSHWRSVSGCWMCPMDTGYCSPYVVPSGQ